MNPFDMASTHSHPPTWAPEPRCDRRVVVRREHAECQLPEAAEALRTLLREARSELAERSRRLRRRTENQ